MIISVHPKLPMRDRTVTLAYYTSQLGFENISATEYPDYLILKKDQAEIHFFLYPGLDPLQNDGQVYCRTRDIEGLYRSLKERQVAIHPAGALSIKPWGQKEFSVLDPDHNLLTFGQAQ